MGISCPRCLSALFVVSGSLCFCPSTEQLGWAGVSKNQRQVLEIVSVGHRLPTVGGSCRGGVSVQ
jgi:hypothetical protein